MTDRTPLRTGAVALMASGCASILFWIMAAWTGTFAGAAVVQQAAWIPARTLHVIAALLVVFGFMSVVIFPAIGRSVPAALEASGVMNQGATLILFITIAAINMIGQVAFGVVTWRAGVLPRPAAALLVIGGLLFNLPPGPVPMIVLAAGGVLWGIAGLWLGWSVEAVVGDPSE